MPAQAERTARNSEQRALTAADVLVARGGGVATLTINRPGKHNALSTTAFRQLIAGLEETARDPTVGVVVLTGAGDKAFCAGGDLAMARDELASLERMRDHHVQHMLRLSSLITQMDKPVLCAVNGTAIGAGVEIACFCDLVVAAEEATFHFNGTQIGGCMWWGPPQLLPLIVGLRKAQEILFLGRPLAAREAQMLGLLNAVVPRVQLESEVARWCADLLDRSPAGLAATKASLRASLDLWLSPLTTAAETNAMVQMGPEARLAFESFLARRPVSWREYRTKGS